jgi:ribosome-binding factor A
MKRSKSNVKSKRGYSRTERIADLIQKELAQMLLQSMDDDRFRLVTVTSVTMSRDLSYAKVYVSVLMDDALKIKQTVDALNRAAKGLRYQLARAVKLRIMPELKFVYDESTAHGFHISNLIDNAIKK